LVPGHTARRINFSLGLRLNRKVPPLAIRKPKILVASFLPAKPLVTILAVKAGNRKETHDKCSHILILQFLQALRNKALTSEPDLFMLYSGVESADPLQA